MIGHDVLAMQGTRIPAQQIVEESELGASVDEIEENYAPSISRAQIRGLLSYAGKHKPQPVP